MLNINTKIEEINRVGEITAKRLKRIGLITINDLLLYFPFRYDDFSETTKIDSLSVGEKVNIVGTIELIQNKRSPRKRMSITEALVSDGSETIKIVWFNQPFIAKNLHSGDTISLSGKIEEDYTGFTMHSPVYEKILTLSSESNPTVSPVHTKGLVPNYHLTANITQKQIRFIINQIVDLSKEIIDFIPSLIVKKEKLAPFHKAIKKIHFPKSFKDIEVAKKRLSFNELFLIQMQSQIIKNELKTRKSIEINFKEKETKEFVDSLPFSLTDAQKKVSWKIIQDLRNNKPMSRLLEGDVGSGKTVVALISLLNVALNGYQGVLMVPTEILAEQHFNSITELLKNYNIQISLITRSHKRTGLKSEILENKTKIISKKSKIIIGTHSLIQEKQEFNNLALAIIDEQHRFGVEQRKNLLSKSNKFSPHLLSMTATPIPRSLALAVYGDLDISIINELPKNRKKIITSLIPEEKRNDAYSFIKKEINKGKQVFVICPLIDISDKLGLKSVKEEYKKLNEIIFPEINIGIMHGKLKPKEKTKAMKDFLDKKTKILVSTSVVEVGVDVKNASIMIIEGSERFGLAQLHQFRGRVGRDKAQSYCFLFSESKSPETKKRLESLVKCDNGFDLAKMDLELRGAGEVYGTAQKGFPELKIASLFDYELMKKAKKYAEEILKSDPELKNNTSLNLKIKSLNKIAHLE